MSCTSTTLSTTNLLWADLDSNPGVYGERSATNHLTYGGTKKKRKWPLKDKDWTLTAQQTHPVCVVKPVS